MEGAPELKRVRVYCGARLPFDWIPSFSRYVGLTLWNTIYLREPFHLDDADSFELLFHELVHVAQFQRGTFKFPLSYLWWLCVRGYLNHPAEIEARRIAAECLAKFKTSALYLQPQVR